jgi:hypothetical protein
MLSQSAAVFLADLVLAVHLAYVLFAVGGEALILGGAVLRKSWVRNRKFRFLHLAAVLFVAFEALAGLVCPLTEWEYRLRTAAGQRAEDDITFIGRLIRSIIFYDFPPLFFTLLYVGFGALVLLTLFFIPPRNKHNR